MSFRKILSTLPASEIERMYPALHEASEEKAVDTFLDFIKAKRKPTNLQTIRKAKKCLKKRYLLNPGFLFGTFSNMSKELNPSTRPP